MKLTISTYLSSLRAEFYHHFQLTIFIAKQGREENGEQVLQFDKTASTLDIKGSNSITVSEW